MAQLRRVFEEACQLPGPDRQAWVRANTDPETAEEVIDLLAAHEDRANPVDLLESMLATAFDCAANPDADQASAAGEMIGPFEVVEVLGAGRSGIVYRVRESFPPREAALKVLRASVWSEHLDARFRTEVRALAKLSHPGIARVLESGTLPEAGGVCRPFILVELVAEARSITAYAAGCPLPRRIALLRELCDAITHAHQNGVLHRDLKPGNVLVGSDGFLRVIDFGIAKLEEAEGPGLTAPGQLMGTPAYMSPEQRAGREADVRTDVYAIGLIGRDILGPLADGDLRAVIEKATSETPEDRYQSASEFGQDLERVLESRPVLARPPSLARSVARFVRRHRVLSASIVAGLLVCGAAVAALVSFARSADRANHEARDAAAFLLDEVIDRLEDQIGGTDDRLALARNVLPRIERLAARSSDDSVLDAHARVLRVIGDCEQFQGRNQEALGHLTQAMELRRRLAERSPRRAEDVAAYSIAMVRTGDVLGEMEQVDERRRLYEASLRIDRELCREHPADGRLGNNLLYSLLRVGELAIARGDYAEGERLAREQLALAQGQLALDPGNADRLLELIQAQAQVDRAVRWVGPSALSRDAQAQSLERTRQMTLISPTSRKLAVRVISQLHQAADAHRAQGRRPEFVAEVEQAVATAARLVEADPKDVEARYWLVVALGCKAEGLAHFNDGEGAVKASERAVVEAEALRRIRGSDHQSVKALEQAIQTRIVALRVAGNLREADAAARTAPGIMLPEQDKLAEVAPARLVRWADALAQVCEPTPEELAKLERAIDEVLRRRLLAEGLPLAMQLQKSGRHAEAVGLVDRITAQIAPADEAVRLEAEQVRRRLDELGPPPADKDGPG